MSSDKIAEIIKKAHISEWTLWDDGLQREVNYMETADLIDALADYFAAEAVCTCVNRAWLDSNIHYINCPADIGEGEVFDRTEFIRIATGS